MTTILGIKTNRGKNGILLASDTQLSIEEGEKLSEKYYIRKITVGDTWVLAHTGGKDRYFLDFERFLLGRGSDEEKAKETIEEAINKLYFPKINQLNKIARKKGEELDDLHSFILAVNEPELNMWEIDEFGNLKRPQEEKDFDYLSSGSGGERASDYIEEMINEEKIDPNNIDIPISIDIAFEALHKAEHDAYTGGPFDLVILTGSGIKSYKAKIKDAYITAEEKLIDEIKSEYL